MSMTYSITEHECVQILSISSLRDEWQNRQVLKELDQQIDYQSSPLVIDMNQLTLINSIGLNFLLSLLKRITKHDGKLVLANVSKGVQRILAITKLSSVFEVQPTTRQAINHCATELELVA